MNQVKLPTYGDKSQIPIGGTLGILAYGYRGIMMWRQVRQQHVEQAVSDLQKQNRKNEEN